MGCRGGVGGGIVGEGGGGGGGGGIVSGLVVNVGTVEVEKNCSSSSLICLEESGIGCSLLGKFGKGDDGLPCKAKGLTDASVKKGIAARGVVVSGGSVDKIGTEVLETATSSLWGMGMGVEVEGWTKIPLVAVGLVGGFFESSFKSLGNWGKF